MERFSILDPRPSSDALKMKSRILLVEDDPRIIKVLAEFLEAAGHLVETEAEGAAGLRHACSGAFDLLIVDVSLPGISGPEICQGVRREGYCGAILMITAVTNVSDGLLGMQVGANDYLVKPFDPAEMVARANILLGNGTHSPTEHTI